MLKDLFKDNLNEAESWTIICKLINFNFLKETING
jgi:hypothetical protein